MFKKTKKRGFTLVEMIIAMSIFVVFSSVLIGSYTSIVKSQRDANDYRLLYSESRSVFDNVSRELREGIVDYGWYKKNGGISPGNLTEIVLISKDVSTRTKIIFDKKDGFGKILLKKGNFQQGQDPSLEDPIWEREVELNSKYLNILSFSFYVSPQIDPYDQNNVESNFSQFHPKVTMSVSFERETKTGKKYSMDLQTMVSSRVYNQLYPITETK